MASARVCIFLCLALLISLTASSAELYRYQDSNGRWVFGDKKSVSGKKPAGQAVEKITIKDHRVKQPRPGMELERVVIEGQLKERRWTLLNPLPVTIQHWLGIKGKKGFITSHISKPFERYTLSSDDLNITDQEELEHFYILGEPIDRPQISSIPPPYLKGKQFRVSQGFNGKFSHTGRGNRYALDIAMPIGEGVLAVKAGIVADARDDFSIGGAANYFLDKANHVTVMHDDGSYGIYAHILYGSLSVQVGQRVEVGQQLARIGSTGYSTGPHLHFVIRYNSGRGAYSIPFKYKTSSGNTKPKFKKYYSGLLDKVE